MTAVLVTGSSGFIGRNLVARLAAGGRKVYALSRSDQENLPGGVLAVTADILKPETYNWVLADCSVLYHCAACITFHAKDAQKADLINVQGTRTVFGAAAKAGLKRGILLSACAVLGVSHTPGRLLDETASPRLLATNVYASSKLAAETAARKASGKAMKLVIANISTVYGRGDRSMNSGSIIRSVRDGMRIIPPGGTSVISMDDLLDGLLLLELRGRAGERYILNAENLPYTDLVRRIASVLRVKRHRWRLPRMFRLPAVLAAAGLEKRMKTRQGPEILTPQIISDSFGYKYFNAAKARQELGWKPQVSLETAVTQAIDYYRTHELW